MEIKQSMANNFKLYNDFVLDVKNIKIDYDVTDYQSVFNNIKIDIACFLMKHIYPRFKNIHLLTTLFHKIPHLRLSNVMDNIHKKICKFNIDNNNCKNCNYLSGYYINNEYSYRGEYKEIPKDIVTKYENHSYKWIKENYQKILNNLITHTELLYIINKLKYDDFYKLFIDSNLIDEYENPIEFLLLIAFIGSNGTVLKLY
jgi:hypothetical protein